MHVYVYAFHMFAMCQYSISHGLYFRLWYRHFLRKRWVMRFVCTHCNGIELLEWIRSMRRFRQLISKDLSFPSPLFETVECMFFLGRGKVEGRLGGIPPLTTSFPPPYVGQALLISCYQTTTLSSWNSFSPLQIFLDKTLVCIFMLKSIRAARLRAFSSGQQPWVLLHAQYFLLHSWAASVAQLIEHHA